MNKIRKVEKFIKLSFPDDFFVCVLRYRQGFVSWCRTRKGTGTVDGHDTRDRCASWIIFRNTVIFYVYLYFLRLVNCFLNVFRSFDCIDNVEFLIELLDLFCQWLSLCLVFWNVVFVVWNYFLVVLHSLIQFSLKYVIFLDNSVVLNF